MISGIRPSIHPSPYHPVEGLGGAQGPLPRSRGLICDICSVVAVFFTELARKIKVCIGAAWLCLKNCFIKLSPSQDIRTIELGGIEGGAQLVDDGEIIKYPAAFADRLRLYQNLPNDPVDLMRHVLKIHRGFLRVKDDEALNIEHPDPARPLALFTFNENLETSDPAALLHILRAGIRALVFNTKQVGYGAYTQRAPAFLKFIVARDVRGYPVHAEPIDKLNAMKQVFLDLPVADKAVFLNHFDTAAAELRFSAEGRELATQLWTDINQMAENTFHGNREWNECIGEVLTGG